MNNETEDEGHMPLSSKRRSGWPMLLRVFILLVLVGATILLFVHQFNQNKVSFANAVPDLSTTIHWQQVQQNNFFPILAAAPDDPATLYICNSLNTSGPGFTVTRSTDAGVHWQTLANPFAGNGICEVAINPANASNLYVATATINSFNGNEDANTTFSLKKSSDGGRSWENVVGMLALSANQRVPWAGYDLTFVGQRLFATQIVNGAEHLISSSDGGNNWSIVDSQLFGIHQEIQSYTVDPSTPDTIYALVGAIVTFEVIVSASDGTPPPIPTPVSLPPERLYRSTDGGASWQKLLDSVFFGSEIQLAPANSHLLYVGGLALDGTDTFHMQVSRNEGTSWQTISAPSSTHLQNKWFVGATGLLYSAPEESTASLIWRYNPSTNRWRTLNLPAYAYHLQSVTPMLSNRGDILWVGSLNGALYRGTS